jgi:hypothetical protein
VCSHRSTTKRPASYANGGHQREMIR